MKEIVIAALIGVAIVSLASISIATSCQSRFLNLTLHSPNGSTYHVGDIVPFALEAKDNCGAPLAPEVRIYYGQNAGGNNSWNECTPVQRVGLNAFVCSRKVSSTWSSGGYNTFVFGFLAGNGTGLPPALVKSKGSFVVQ